MVGETYRCEVPYDVRRSRHVVGDQADPVARQIEIMRWTHLAATRFPLTIVDVDRDRRPATAQGIRSKMTSMIRVDLTLDQQLELALPPGAYYVEGILHRVDDVGSVVDLPDLEVLTVPTRWLHPLNSPLSPSSPRCEPRW